MTRQFLTITCRNRCRTYFLYQAYKKEFLEWCPRNIREEICEKSIIKTTKYDFLKWFFYSITIKWHLNTYDFYSTAGGSLEGSLVLCLHGAPNATILPQNCSHIQVCVWCFCGVWCTVEVEYLAKTKRGCSVARYETLVECLI